eukprot:scaffold272196_cov27-Tisochrysis_lutea.AAC.2
MERRLKARRLCLSKHRCGVSVVAHLPPHARGVEKHLRLPLDESSRVLYEQSAHSPARPQREREVDVAIGELCDRNVWQQQSSGGPGERTRQTEE